MLIKMILRGGGQQQQQHQNHQGGAVKQEIIILILFHEFDERECDIQEMITYVVLQVVVVVPKMVLYTNTASRGK